MRETVLPLVRIITLLAVLFSLAAQASSLDTPAVKKVVRRAHPAWTRCYERALKVDPSLQGRVELVLEVKRSGHVDSARLRRSLGRPALDACLVKVARTLRFDRGPTPFTVVWPVIFQSTL